MSNSATPSSTQSSPPPSIPPDGFVHASLALDRVAQREMLTVIRAVLAEAPLYTPAMPRTGKPLSVRISNCGPLGWISDKSGYRYQQHHPITGRAWPDIPPQILKIWARFAPEAMPPEACLINWYDPTAKLGSHVDKDEQTFDSPVISISLGDDAIFHVGGRKRGDAKHRVTLKSGDVVVLGGGALDQPGRFNLTLRRVTADTETPKP